MTTPKEIARLADRIFATTVPANVAIRSQQDQEDCGIDYELELKTEDDKGTGFIFKIQQKGVDGIPFNADEQTISYSDLLVERVGYYLTQLRIPVILVVVDVKSKTAYWTRLQGVPAVRDAYNKAMVAEQETMTVRLPIENVLPGTFDKLLKAVDDTASWLIVQQVCAAGSTELLGAAVTAAKVGDAGKAINVQHDVFRSKEIEDLVGAGQLDDAYKRALSIFQSAAERTEMRFAAGWNLVRIYPALLMNRGDADRQRLTTEHSLAVTSKMLQITMAKGTGRSLRLFAAFLHRNARLRAWVQKDLGLFMSSEAQRANQVFTFGMMQAERMPTANAVVKQLRRTQRLFLGMLRSSMYLVPQAWIEMVGSTVPFLTRLRFEKLNDAADSLMHWFDETGRLAIDISLPLRNWGDATGCALQSLSLSMGDEQGFDARVASAREAINRIPEPEVRQRGLQQLDANAAELRAASTRTADINDEPEMIRQMAAAMGIDLSDETDRIAQIVNIGIRDLNPERALRSCRYLFVQTGPSGIPAQMLALPTAGWKSIRCTKFGYGSGALELDSAYHFLKTSHCDSCSACEPHPPEWKWTPGWQEQQHRLHYESPDKEDS